MPEDVLFLPGLLCDARLWRHQVRYLAAFVRPVVADLTHDDRIDAMAERALRLMPGRFALCGLSMGGYVAFAILRRAPERVTRLCLMDTSARPDTPEQARRRRGMMAILAGSRFRGVTPRLLPTLLHPDRLADAELAQEIMAMAQHVGREGFLRQQTAILHRPDSRPDLPRIAVPALVVVVGSHDQVTPRECAEEMAAGMPHARLVVVGGSGHLPPLERPDAVNRLLAEWLQAPI